MDFYHEQAMFSCNTEQMKQLVTVFKTDEHFTVLFAASFFVIQLGNIIYGFIDMIRTAESVQRQGFASTFIGHLKGYIESEMVRCKKYEAAFIIVG